MGRALGTVSLLVTLVVVGWMLTAQQSGSSRQQQTQAVDRAQSTARELVTPYGWKTLRYTGPDPSYGYLVLWTDSSSSVRLERWTWDGNGFVHTASATTGMCKLIAAGGPWELPTIVTEVKKGW